MSLSKELLEEQFNSGNWKLYKTYPELETYIGQNSIDVTLSPYFLIKNPSNNMWVEFETILPEIGVYKNSFILGSVNERIDCSNPIRIEGKDRYFYPCIETRSTIARNGVCSHINAGLGDYGFDGFFTLEIFNFNHHLVYLKVKKRFAQITFRELITGGIPPKNKYNSIYNTYENKPVLPKER